MLSFEALNFFSMKYRVLLFFILLFAARPVASQVLISLLFGDDLNSGKVEFGLDGGLNSAYMKGLESNKPYNLFNIGFYFDIKVKNNWAVYTGVLVKSNTGQNQLTPNDLALLDTLTFLSQGNYKQRITWFHVPIMMKYRFKNHFFAGLGPQAALRTKASLFYEYEQNNRKLTTEYDNRELFHRLEFGLIGMVGYKLHKGQGMNLGIKYYYGLTDILRSTNAKLYSRSFYVFVGIPIGRQKALEAEKNN